MFLNTLLMQELYLLMDLQQIMLVLLVNMLLVLL